jgi:hypothetical protein
MPKMQLMRPKIQFEIMDGLKYEYPFISRFSFLKSDVLSEERINFSGRSVLPVFHTTWNIRREMYWWGYE